MDKDRIEGSAKEIKGKTKEVAGKMLGDAKLESEGKADQAAGKIQNAVGGVKDTLKGSNHCGEVPVARAPCFAPLSTRKQCEQLAKNRDRRRVIGCLPRF